MEHNMESQPQGNDSKMTTVRWIALIIRDLRCTWLKRYFSFINCKAICRQPKCSCTIELFQGVGYTLRDHLDECHKINKYSRNVCEGTEDNIDCMNKLIAALEQPVDRANHFVTQSSDASPCLNATTQQTGAQESVTDLDLKEMIKQAIAEVRDARSRLDTIIQQSMDQASDAGDTS
ncbi:PREDICTED: uncharacterized protein LOC105567152 [Vollenhovia emeryi]|uniref:uncharacterized protein LOC105567152 n=1 Tax=Vollenhovia emeryi TaxID=411798 RepID=UPI0005F3E6CF|nr:PREDICTED: uncharacterized protein LOC105567152 [Vollenhovia emeryi]